MIFGTLEGTFFLVYPSFEVFKKERKKETLSNYGFYRDFCRFACNVLMELKSYLLL